MIAHDLKKFAWLSIAAAVVTILLKGIAWWLTGSVGLLSDALESFVNLAGALMALAMLTLAEQPADDNHAYGHTKAEYFSSAFEGFLIFLAAISIAYTAVERFIHPQELEAVGVGLIVSVLATIINFWVARVLLKTGIAHNSITLEADAHHLMTDVWTSVGVIAAVGLVGISGWIWLDPLIAILVAINIVWTGWQLMQRSASGLMDGVLDGEKLSAIRSVLQTFEAEGICFESLKTRQAGRQSFVSLHVLVPGAWTVKVGHDWLDKIEAAIKIAVPGAQVSTHLEPVDEVQPNQSTK